jgi:hypothetical protein
LGIFYIDEGIKMVKNRKSYEPLFISNVDYQNNARINQNKTYGLDLFAEGYKTAADVLVKHIVEDNTNQDTLVYPIVFLYRQYIELRLKEIIREGWLLLNEEQDFPKTHKLDKLWLTVNEIIEKVYAHEGSDDSDDLGLVEHLIHKFSAIDPESMSFRYPEGLTGNNLLVGLEDFDIQHLSKMIERLFFFLDGVSAGVSAYRDYESESGEEFY